MLRQLINRQSTVPLLARAFSTKPSTSTLVAPHGGKGLVTRLLAGADRDAEVARAASLPRLDISSRENGDLIMMGIGGFSPLTGFMKQTDWRSVCDNMTLQDGTFWPIPITMSAPAAAAHAATAAAGVALYHQGELMGTMDVDDVYEMTDAMKSHECEKVFQTSDDAHPGVAMVRAQDSFNLGGSVSVLSEGAFPTEFAGVYKRPVETRAEFDAKGWSTTAALQLRNPMHRSHEYLAKIAAEVCDGVFIHSLVGNLKPGDIPAHVRVKCIDTLVDNYFVKEHISTGGYPLDMRYGGPREALLHALFRQNYGCSHMIIGRDHAGVGDYYGMFDAQTIFDKLPINADAGKNLLTKPLKIDWTFFCHKCDGPASMRTCPHGKEDRVIVSGTMLRKLLSEKGAIPDHFGREEVLAVLREYYEGLADADNVKVELHGAATGDVSGRPKA